MLGEEFADLIAGTEYQFGYIDSSRTWYERQTEGCGEPGRYGKRCILSYSGLSV